MNRRLLAAALLLAPFVAAAASAAQPNVVIFLADDQGWGDLSVHGNENLQTPSIDSLAKDGALFDRFFVCPVCSPTRAEFLTGRYHPRGGVFSTSTGGERLDLDEKTIAETFKAAGYATGAFGKWHNGMQWPYHPNARGFDEFYGFCSGHWGHYFSPELEHNGKLVRGEGYVTDDFTNHALAFIEQNRERPFFCYLPYNVPHSPMQVPDEYFREFAGRELALRHREPEQEEVVKTKAALAMCECIERNVGRVLKKLDELKLADNTIVIYFSDNGPNSWRWNGKMKGRKGATDEGGVRVPFLIRWPGKIKAGSKIEEIAAAIDLLPTLADLAEIEIVGDKPLDGVSLKPLLLGEETSRPERMIFSHWSGRVSVRTQQHRLDHQGKLFDMQADPQQSKDVSAEHPEIAKELSQAAQKWRKEVLSELDKSGRPFTVGYEEFPRTELPARDGEPHGGVKRSAGAPNCSYFTNWKSVDDTMTWDIEVATAGKYEAVVHYTCEKENAGSTIELSFGEGMVSAKITEPHDPPLVGEEEDRVDRGSESFVKNFKPLSLGILPLEKGRGLLTLKATEIPGAGIADVRRVELYLVSE